MCNEFCNKFQELLNICNEPCGLLLWVHEHLKCNADVLTVQNTTQKFLHFLEHVLFRVGLQVEL